MFRAAAAVVCCGKVVAVRATAAVVASFRRARCSRRVQARRSSVVPDESSTSRVLIGLRGAPTGQTPTVRLVMP